MPRSERRQVPRPAKSLFAAVIWIGFLLVQPAMAQQPVVLVTNEEAALPPLPEPGDGGKGVTRGPGIEVLAPGNNSTISATPTPFRVRFVPRNDVPINPDKVRITYLRSQPIDITLRVRSYVSANGIDIPQAIVPPGHHSFRIEVIDGMGRQAAAVLRFDAKGKT